MSAAYRPRTGTLLIAGAHRGLAAAFRRAGVTVPRCNFASIIKRR